MMDSIKEELWAWEGINKKKKVTRLIPLTVWSIIWKERNGKVSYGIENDIYYD